MTPALGYTEMKDSGIPWVGNVPADWEVFPAGGVFKEVKEKNTDNKFTNPFSFRYGEIVDKKIIGGIDESVEETLSAYRVVSPNTIMLNGLNLNYDFISQRVAIVKEPGIITSAYLAVKPDEKRVYPYFVLYLLKAYDYRQVLHSIGSGIRKTLKYQDFKSIKIVAPTMDKQKEIVTYLNAQCAKIDEIIAEAKASIEDYKKWKASIIYEAVTKGLDPDVEMKESGVHWIGKIPWNWSVRKISSCFDEIGSGTTPKSEEDDYYSGDIHWLQSGDINGGFVDNTAKCVNERAIIDCSTLRVYKAPFIAVAMYGASIANTSIVLVDSCTNQACCVLSKPKNTNLIYAFYAVISSKGELLISAKGSTQPNISQEILKQLRLPIPPIEEQLAIANHLNAQCAKIDELITEKQSLISDLESYKKSLIYEVVTGKRRVC